ncbi:hypothetical protein Sgleb_73400 [Streptomyces glebosus]|uniref:Uncharacterized protein n=1 Tax=Streptomyces glebosus TaxID=249580 RepID=A0A640T6E7_9ACTN|nr:hypothetical protein Sgleb_73400 [Streptomyces glebosus]GHG79163.1 hypothetical protein GCM10010513_56280 [Streptomyces glebosus]
MMFPEGPKIPALTEAESQVVDAYLAVLKRLSGVNPTQTTGTYTALRAAQALVTETRALRDALSLMFERQEKEIHVRTMETALRSLDGDRFQPRLGPSSGEASADGE